MFYHTMDEDIGVMVDVSGADAEQISAGLATLDSLGIKATWFLDATTVESCPQVVKDIAAKGNEFGLKGTDQKAIDKLSPVEVKDPLLRSRQAFVEAGVQIVPFLYPPSGRYSETIVTVAFQGGLESVRPAFDASAMRGKEDAAASKLSGSVKPGDFLILRVGRKGLQPAQAYLVALQESLFERQITAVPLSTLVKGVK
jgi:peptidoglycan/xylan/chitin deacetylase (PgdA/CDA1 family)